MDRQLETTMKIRIVQGIYYITLCVFLLFYLLPFWGAITTSLKSAGEVLTTNPLSLPQRPTLKGYIDAFNHLRKPLLNSLLATCGGAFFSVFLVRSVGMSLPCTVLNMITSNGILTIA
jgi:ABC-type glycerol-3-phosphate transport system permease component